MLHYDFEVGEKAYRLRMGVRDVMVAEKALGRNPIALFMEGDAVPTVTEMVTILHAALQKNHHGMSLTAAADLFEEWMDEGHAMTDFIPVIIEIYKVSGLIAKDGEGKN